MSDEKESEKPVSPEESIPVPERSSVAVPDVDPTPEEEAAIGAEAVRSRGSNDYFRLMMDRNFLEYASYVIKDRAIPDVDDGLKPVQRRILWSLFRIDDGRTHKAANVIGNTMHFHPHGDASIGDALVVLANKEYFITRQGNFGNIFTGSPAAAPRYIECSLSPMGREVLFNNDITEFVDSYDGRNREPVVLPVKIPSLLMLGSDGIAVGMATRIMPHNFNELLRAQIAVLRGESFALYPDFQQGGVMDVREYADGNGKITLRAKIEIDGRRLVVREIPATTTTESLIASIEKAAEKSKIKISSVTDYTANQVEVEIVPTRGYDPEKTLQALYMYTDCSVSISVNLTVIRENRPVQMSVTEVIGRNTAKLLEYLKRELEIDLARQEDLFHAKTLAQIFFENRIYKKIEECRSQEEEYAEVHAGLAPFRDLLRRDVTDEDIDRLLALPVRRISRFDIEKNQRELAEVLARMKEIRRHLGHLTQYAIDYLEQLLVKYGEAYPRRTEIEHFEKIDRREAALNNIKVGWDRKNGYIGTGIRSDDILACNEFDRFVLVEKTGSYKVIALPPEKLFVGRLYDLRKYDENTMFGVIYRETKSGKYYGKRSSIGGFILDKEYALCPSGCKLELLTPRPDAVYLLTQVDGRGRTTPVELNLMELPERSPKARGILVSGKSISKITHQRYLSEEELAVFRSNQANDGEMTDQSDGEMTDSDISDISPLSEPPPEPEANSGDIPAEGKDREVPPVPVKEKKRSVEIPEPPKQPGAPVAEEKAEKKAGEVVPVPVKEKKRSVEIPEPPEQPAASVAEEKAGEKPRETPAAVAAVAMNPEEAPPWDESAPPPSIAEAPRSAVRPAPYSELPPPEVRPVELGIEAASGLDAALVLDADAPAPRRRSKPVRPVSEKGAEPPAARPPEENDDSFGIVQPEFGF